VLQAGICLISVACVASFRAGLFSQSKGCQHAVWGPSGPATPCPGPSGVDRDTGDHLGLTVRHSWDLPDFRVCRTSGNLASHTQKVNKYAGSESTAGVFILMNRKHAGYESTAGVFKLLRKHAGKKSTAGLFILLNRKHAGNESTAGVFILLNREYAGSALTAGIFILLDRKHAGKKPTIGVLILLNRKHTGNESTAGVFILMNQKHSAGPARTSQVIDTAESEARRK
jgi:hypothetical protein